MSCVTSREVLPPSGGLGLRGPLRPQDLVVFGPADANAAADGGSVVSLSFKCTRCTKPDETEGTEGTDETEADMEWGYAEHNGPDKWHQKFPLAAGPRQSPVDLSSNAVNLVRELAASATTKPLHRRYNPQSGCSLTNTGYGWKVQISGPSAARKDDLNFWFSELSGGPLSSRYCLEQFHMHWGPVDNEGSEHTVDGQSYAGELHLVHWNCDKYESFAEAASKPDGLAVLGVFLKVGEPLKELLKVTDLMGKVAHKGDHVDVKGEIDPTNLLPANSSYWTYLGSLTTPPCNESVIWIVFKEALTISQEQLDGMRALRCYSQSEECPCDNLKGQLLKNFRPPLPLGNRVLRECRE